MMEIRLVIQETSEVNILTARRIQIVKGKLKKILQDLGYAACFRI